MGLIAVSTKHRKINSNYLYFTDRLRWTELKELFAKEACQLFHINQIPLLKNVLQVGISSIKTANCSENKCMKKEGSLSFLDSQSDK